MMKVPLMVLSWLATHSGIGTRRRKKPEWSLGRRHYSAGNEAEWRSISRRRSRRRSLVGNHRYPRAIIRAYTLGDVKVKGAQVKFNMPNIPGDPAFDGKLSEDGKSGGRLHQNGQTFPFALERGEAKEPPVKRPPRRARQRAGGHWQGSLRPSTAPVELRVVLHVARERTARSEPPSTASTGCQWNSGLVRRPRRWCRAP